MVIKLLTAHASVRKYKDITLTKEEVHELIRAGQHAASSHFVQAYSVIHVTDVEKRRSSRNSRKIRNRYYRQERPGLLHGLL